MDSNTERRLPVLINLNNQERYVMDGPSVEIGRAAVNKIVLENDEYASGVHARIFWSDGAWWLEDLGSSNGTCIDDKIISEPIKLSPGAVIKVGRTKFRIE